MIWLLKAIVLWGGIVILINFSRAEDLIFKEEFSPEKLSPIKWGIPTLTLYNFRADPEMVINAGGINYFRLAPSESEIYPTGFIYTKEHFSYGSYSARIKVSDVPGAVASFFACSEIAKVFSDGTHDEIDFELITARPHAVLMTTWYMGTGMEGFKQTLTHNSSLWEDPSFDIRDWHVYRFDWYPERVEFYIDGIKRWTSRRAIPETKDADSTAYIHDLFMEGGGISTHWRCIPDNRPGGI